MGVPSPFIDAHQESAARVAHPLERLRFNGIQTLRARGYRVRLTCAAGSLL